jgi:hypothetical protein
VLRSSWPIAATTAPKCYGPEARLRTTGGPRRYKNKRPAVRERWGFTCTLKAGVRVRVASSPWRKRARGVGSFEPAKARRRTYTRGRTSIPSERLHAEIDELFASDCELALILEGVARLSVRLMKQSALEAEIDAFLGRARYQRRTAGPVQRKGWQPPASVKSTMGPETRDYRSVSAASRRRRLT